MPDFPEFALDRKLRSCVLTRELLQQVEKQILAAERDLGGDSPMIPAQPMSVAVFDAFGTESFRSAADIPTSGFPESTEAVRVVVESSTEASPSQRSFKCKLAFRSSHGIHLSLRFRGPQARERAVGLYERIRQLTESQSLDAWLFRRREWLEGIAGLIAVFGGLVWLGQTYSLLTSPAVDIDRIDYSIFTTIWTTSVAYLAVVRLFFPQCAFETAKWSRLQEWRTWAAQGFVGLLVFDTAAFLVGRQVVSYLGRLLS